jgi:SAM-dependent methyltransferase
MDGDDPYSQQTDHWNRCAPFYDTDSAGHLDPHPAVDFLLTLAADGPALELGIGSGRIALPLAEHGIPISGIDTSPEMIALLHARRGSRPVDARIADMAGFRSPPPFPYPLVYVAASTLLTARHRRPAAILPTGRRRGPRSRWQVRHRGSPAAHGRRRRPARPRPPRRRHQRQAHPPAPRSGQPSGRYPGTLPQHGRHVAHAALPQAIPDAARAGYHSPHRRPPPASPLRRMGSAPAHICVHPPRLGLRASSRDHESPSPGDTGSLTRLRTM